MQHTHVHRTHAATASICHSGACVCTRSKIASKPPTVLLALVLSPIVTHLQGAGARKRRKDSASSVKVTNGALSSADAAKRCKSEPVRRPKNRTSHHAHTHTHLHTHPYAHDEPAAASGSAEALRELLQKARMLVEKKHKAKAGNSGDGYGDSDGGHSTSSRGSSKSSRASSSATSKHQFKPSTFGHGTRAASDTAHTQAHAQANRRNSQKTPHARRRAQSESGGDSSGRRRLSSMAESKYDSVVVDSSMAPSKIEMLAVKEILTPTFRKCKAQQPPASGEGPAADQGRTKPTMEDLGSPLKSFLHHLSSSKEPTPTPPSSCYSQSLPTSVYKSMQACQGSAANSTGHAAITAAAVRAKVGNGILEDASSSTSASSLEDTDLMPPFDQRQVEPRRLILADSTTAATATTPDDAAAATTPLTTTTSTATAPTTEGDTEAEAEVPTKTEAQAPPCGSESGESSASSLPFFEEDLSDKAYLLRHAELEVQERARFLAPIPGSVQKRPSKKGGANASSEATTKTPLKSKGVQPCPTPPRAQVTLVVASSPAPATRSPVDAAAAAEAEAARWEHIPTFPDRQFPLSLVDEEIVTAALAPARMTYELNDDEDAMPHTDYAQTERSHSSASSASTASSSSQGSSSTQGSSSSSGSEGSSQSTSFDAASRMLGTVVMHSSYDQPAGIEELPPLKVTLKLPIFAPTQS